MRPFSGTPGSFRQWRPETETGFGVAATDWLMVERRGIGFPIEALLGPAELSAGTCFVEGERKNCLAKTKVDPRKDWWLSGALEVVGLTGGGSYIVVGGGTVRTLIRWLLVLHWCVSGCCVRSNSRGDTIALWRDCWSICTLSVPQEALFQFAGNWRLTSTQTRVTVPLWLLSKRFP